MIRLPLFRVILLVILFPFAVTTASANVTGIVRGVQQNPIAGALVTFTSEANPALSFSGYTNAGGQYNIAIAPLSVGDVTPAPFTLRQNHPNPFNPATTITFSIAEPGLVTLSIYNILGQRIRTLVNGIVPAGDHAMVWDGRDYAGFAVGAGVYLYRLTDGTRVEVKKMLLLDGGGAAAWTSSAAVAPAPKPAAATWTVTITGDDIEPREINGLEVVDYGSYDFYVIFMGELMNFHLIPITGGTFEMGEAWALEFWYTIFGLPHPVTLSDFEMSAYEITNAQYAQFLNEALAAGEIEMIGDDPCGKGGEWNGMRYIDLDIGLTPQNALRECFIIYQNGSFKVEEADKQHWPVAAVTWYGAKAFAVHYGFDLPTEAEWEYAAGGGTLEYEYATDDGTIDDTKANYNGTIGHPVVVGIYPPNPLGLYDMSGNITEWCNDWFASYTREPIVDPLVDPVGPETGSTRIVRGYSYSASINTCRTTYRGFIYPEAILGGTGAVKEDFGFRVVRR